jgi:transposase
VRTKLPPYKAPKYNFKDFSCEFPDDAACLGHVFKTRYPNGLTCPKCGAENRFHPVPGRRAYACVCAFQVYPTAGSVFHKSTTPLKTWFHALYLMTASKNGVAALELQRQIGVTYKCAWRMMHQIRALMCEEVPPMKGTVEVDETYVGGKRPGKRGRGAAGKAIVVGALERGGNVAPFVVTQANAETAEALLAVTTEPTAKIVTDEYSAYHGLKRKGYDHESISHRREEWVRGSVHTNGIEGFWSQMKRSIDGTHHGVSKKHLQKYADEFAFRYNRRRSKVHMFRCLVAQLTDTPF